MNLRPIVVALAALALVVGAMFVLLREVPRDDGGARLDVPTRPADAPAMEDLGARGSGQARPLEGLAAPASDVTASALGTDDALAVTDALGAVRVVVSYDDGRAASGVGVRLVVHGPGAVEGPTPRVRTTDSGGEARFGRIVPGGVVASSDRGGRVTGDVVAGRPVTLALRLPRGALVEGRVVDARGAAVPGAAVWLTRWSSDEGTLVARGDRDGAFVLEGVGRDGALGATAPGLQPSPRVRLDERIDPAAPVVLRLGDGGARLIGLVRDGDGRPVAGATVQVGGPDGWAAPPGSRDLGPAPRRAVSDAGGAFAFDGLPSGTTTVAAHAPPFGPFERTVELDPEAPRHVELVLVPGGVLRGDVVDRSGAPLVGARVMLRGHRLLSHATATTDASGRFGLTGLAAGHEIVQVVHPDFVPATASVVVDPAAPAELHVVLERGGVIAGHVLEASTRVPVVGALVTTAFGLGGASTGADGGFSLAGLEGETFTVLVFRTAGDGSAVEVARVEGVPPDGEPLELLVEPPFTAGEVRGVLRDLRDRPLPGVLVTLAAKGRADGFGDVTRTDDDGAFRFARLAPRTYTVDGRFDAGAFPRVDDVVVTEGGVTDLGVLRPLLGGRLAVRLLANDPTLLDDVSLRADRAGGVESRRLVVADGRAELDELSPGRWTVRLAGRGVVPRLVEVEIAAGVETAIDVDVRGGVSQAFTLRWSDGERPRSCAARVERDGRPVVEWPPLMREVATWGTTTTLEPGDYGFVVTEDGEELARRAFTVDVAVPAPTIVIDF